MTVVYFPLINFQATMTTVPCKVKRSPVPSIWQHSLLPRMRLLTLELIMDQLEEEKVKGKGYFLLEGYYLEGELRTITQIPTYLSKLVTWPYLDAGRLEMHSLLWVTICRVNILITMGKGEYGYLETASVCQIFQHLLSTL